MGTIYKITNKINNNAYIGLTNRAVEIRWTEHTNYLNTSYDSQQNSLIHIALRKYGKENFTFEVLEDNIPVEELNKREQYWIAYYDTFTHGYNMTPGGDMKPLKYDYNELLEFWQQGLSPTEISQKIGINQNYLLQLLLQLGITHNEIKVRSNQYKSVPVEQYTLDGKYIQTFSSIRQAALNLGNEDYTGNISAACKGKITSFNHYLWKTVDNPIDISVLVQKAKTKQHHGKQAIDQYDLNGNFITTFNTATDAIHAVGLKYVSSITNVIKGRSKSAAGYYWKYHEE